jgi:hypothetical protein
MAPSTPIAETEILRNLERRIQEIGTLTAAAGILKVSPQLLSAVLSRKRGIGPALLRSLGIRRTVRRVVTYELVKEPR